MLSGLPLAASLGLDSQYVRPVGRWPGVARRRRSPRNALRQRRNEQSARYVSHRARTKRASAKTEGEKVAEGESVERNPVEIATRSSAPEKSHQEPDQEAERLIGKRREVQWSFGIAPHLKDPKVSGTKVHRESRVERAQVVGFLENGV